MKAAIHPLMKVQTDQTLKLPHVKVETRKNAFDFWHGGVVGMVTVISKSS